jgi:Holliday junction resolvase
MTNSRSKGQRGERLLADVLQEHGWPLARRSGQTDGRQCADVVGGPDGIHLEVKFAERLNVRDAYAQANFDAPAQDTPIVAWKKKRQPWLAVLSLDDLLALLR